MAVDAYLWPCRAKRLTLAQALGARGVHAELVSHVDLDVVVKNEAGRPSAARAAAGHRTCCRR
eukprot:90105-Pyramimonas_sp.AAC.1